MSIESMMNHKCDIYHIRRYDESPGYGLPESPTFSYPDMPDIEDQLCRFGVRNGARRVARNEPETDYVANIKLALPAGTDIRLNDKIVDKSTGIEYEYTAGIPVDVRGHHMFVMIGRTTAQEAL